MTYVYRHIRLDKNEPFYIGIGIDPKRSTSKEGRNKYWKHIIKLTDYRIEIMLEDLTWLEACEKEKEFIKLYGRKDLGIGTLVNMTDGGDGTTGYIMPEESKKERSIKSQGIDNPFYGKTHTLESLLKISETSKGRIKSDEQIQKWKISMNFQKSPETREKIRQTLLGRTHTEERKHKNSLSHIGQIMSEESKQKLSIARKGIKRGSLTKEHVQKLKDSHKGILQSEETKLKRKHTWELKRLAKQK